jgi:CelD/BcsL family acetyltransferase involved in cellulose biosynthesis
MQAIQPVTRMTDASLPSLLPTSLRRGRMAPFASVEVHETAAEILAVWSELEQVAPCSAYQTRAFVLAWLATLGKAGGLAPLFIAAKDAQGRVVALFCLGIEERGGLRRAVFLGGKDSNFNLGLFRAPEVFARAEVEAVLRTAAKMLGRKAPDIFLLVNQPHIWAGLKNPFALLPHQPSPSFAFGTPLPRDAEHFFSAKQSKERRKKLRKKEARLAEMGALRHITNSDPDAARAILTAFFAQKAPRCETQAIGVDFSDPCRQSFYEDLSLPRVDRAPPLELHALACGSRIVAVFGGMPHRECFSGMIISFDSDPDIARSSPGELLLLRAIAAQCQRGITSFDLGIGKADYKATYCDTPIALFDVLFPITLKGRLYALFESLRLRLKRAVKQEPKLFAILQRVKRALHHARHA